MSVPDPIMDIFLHPGDFYFGDAGTRIRTLLGSCVSITVWHPYALIGGMCHYVLPSRLHREMDEPLNGRYADEVMELFLHEMETAGTMPSDYQVKIFGGGRQFSTDVSASTIDVPERNVQVGLDLLASHGMVPIAMHLGGAGHRQVIFDISSGDVWLSHADRTPQELTP